MKTLWRLVAVGSFAAACNGNAVADGATGDSAGGGDTDTGGGDEASGGDSAPLVITHENLHWVMASGYCDFLVRCGEELGPTFPTRERCRNLLLGVFAIDAPDGMPLLVPPDPETTNVDPTA